MEKERPLILKKPQLCLQGTETSQEDPSSEEAIFKWPPAGRQAFWAGLFQAHCSSPPGIPRGIYPHLLVRNKTRFPQRGRQPWVPAPGGGAGQPRDLGAGKTKFLEQKWDSLLKKGAAAL